MGRSTPTCRFPATAARRDRAGRHAAYGRWARWSSGPAIIAETGDVDEPRSDRPRRGRPSSGTPRGGGRLSVPFQIVSGGNAIYARCAAQMRRTKPAGFGRFALFGGTIVDRTGRCERPANMICSTASPCAAGSIPARQRIDLDQGDVAGKGVEFRRFRQSRLFRRRAACGARACRATDVGDGVQADVADHAVDPRCAPGCIEHLDAGSDRPASMIAVNAPLSTLADRRSAGAR